MKAGVVRSFSIVIGAVIIAALLLAAILLAFMPLRIDSREEVFEIPKGTWAQRMSGNSVSILPDQIYLALGVRDLLVLRNLDDVPQMFGPTLIMPGQSFKLPFELASEYDFACTAHASGQMKVVVDPEPTPGWYRFLWRIKNVFR